LNKFLTLSQLNEFQLAQYNQAIIEAFPYIISQSDIILRYWNRLEDYYPQFQFYLLASDGELIGFMNTIPFHFSRPVDELPDQGWDWMLRQGIKDYENHQQTNYLGGLQVIVRKKFQGQGFSKQLLTYAKHVMKSSNLENLIIPIRPTKKHEFPWMSMDDYLNYKEEDALYDPWIKTHLKNGAKVIKICQKSMSITGDVSFWEKILNQKLVRSGEYLLAGALSPITINLESDSGAYIEANIWIRYDKNFVV